MRDNETLAVIRRRRSIRSFKPDPIAQDALEAILEAALYAPNAGDQPWHFAAVTNGALLADIDRMAKEAARKSPLPWLAELGRDDSFHSLYGAPAALFISCEEQGPAAQQDAAAATQNALLAAESLGIGSCWGYFATQAFQAGEGPSLAARLGIPAGHRVYTSVALGYAQGEPPQAPARKEGLITYIR